MKKVVVIGWGSIGRRYAVNLEEMGHKVIIFTQRETSYKTIQTIEKLLDEDPDLVIVANQTGKHGDTLKDLRKHGYHNRVLMEKPLDTKIASLPTEDKLVWVGYHLRFHPIIKILNKTLQGKDIVAFQASVGQHLSQWRPGRDYRDCYSAKKLEGGGVLRDLSHELDLVLYLIGDCHKLVSQITHTKTLDIETEDCVSMLMQSERCPHVSVNFDYLDHLVHRDLKIHCLNESFHVDLLQGTLKTCDQSLIYTPDRNRMMKEMLEEALSKNPSPSLCTYKEGLTIMKWIESAEQSMEKKSWVSCG
ncbi:MAG: Gfo/Idh/MocA family protein [Oligoflexales bacterium]